jgi:hypothetical protein
MSRKHRNRRRQPFRCFTFSPETVKLLQQAMKLFAQSLGRAEAQAEKLVFAREVIQQVNEKLDAMWTSVGVMCLTRFDYNEKIVIAAAIQLYMLELMAVSVSPQREKELQRCQQLMRFALDSEWEPER